VSGVSKDSAVRLKQGEQVRDRKTEAVGFGTSKGTFAPYQNLSVTQIRQLIFSTIWAETCIETIVDEVTKYPLYTDPENEDIDTFLKFPSDKEPQFLIRKQYLKDMLRWGNGGCIIEYKNKKPNQLVVVPGYTIRVTDDEPHKYKLLKLGSTTVFETDANGNDLEFSQQELMHFCINKDSDSTLARSPIERIYSELVGEQESAKKVTELIKSGFHKPAFISFKKGSTINKKDLEAFIEYMNALIVGGAKLLGINKEVDLKELPFMSSNEVIEMQKWIGLKVASVYKVPPFMMNLVSDTGSLNAREQKARFLENVVMPIIQYEAFLYTNVLVRKGFKKLDVEITSHVLGTKLNYDRAKIANMLVGDGMNGILTLDEARKLFFNLPPKGSEKLKK
jgi:phage portal protein BeeE